MLYSSDSDNDSDFLGPTPPPATKKATRKVPTTTTKSKPISQVTETASSDKKVRGGVGKNIDVFPVTETVPDNEKKCRTTKTKTADVSPVTEVTPTEKKVRARATKAVDVFPVAGTSTPEIKVYRNKKTKTSSVAESNSSNRSTAVKTAALKDAEDSEPIVKNKQENKFFKSKTAAADSEEDDLSTRLAATKIADSKDSRLKRTTRSTRK